MKRESSTEDGTTIKLSQYMNNVLFQYYRFTFLLKSEVDILTNNP